MFDRFTDLAKSAVTMARKEAQYAQQDSIGTGHLLLGLIGGESGVAVEVLGHFKVDLKDLRNAAGNERPSGRTPGVRAQLPFSREAKAVLERTLEEARELGHD